MDAGQRTARTAVSAVRAGSVSVRLQHDDGAFVDGGVKIAVGSLNDGAETPGGHRQVRHRARGGQPVRCDVQHVETIADRRTMHADASQTDNQAAIPRLPLLAGKPRRTERALREAFIVPCRLHGSCFRLL